MKNQDQKISAVIEALNDLFESRSEEINLVDVPFVEFKAGKNGSNVGKGIVWSGQGTTKQIIFTANPDRFYSSESIDLAAGKNISINNVSVVNEKELGPSVVKSNLRELGRLKGLTVDGSVNINQYLFYDAASDRLGIGTDAPNASVSILENGVEVMIGTTDHSRGAVGTYASNDFDIVTDNTPRISVSKGGDIELGNKNFGPVKVSVNGKLGVNVSHPDQRADLHIAGSIKFNDKLHLSGTESPSYGNHVQGDIVWNSNPSINSYVGWVCVQAGSPGQWLPFGSIQPK